MLAIALVALGLAATARADTPPSGWDRAREAGVGAAYTLHQQVQLLLLRESELDPMHESKLDRALGLLTTARVESSKSPLLRYDLAYVYAEKRDYPRAVQIYRATIAEFPDHPATEHAWLRLAFACGHIGDNACELESYTKVLSLETEDVLRATPILNLAETQMHLGDLKEAIAGYREALRLAGRFPGRETAPLATWGLAVALDRTGDRIAAEKEAKFAIELERSMGMKGILESSDVFFYPEYELRWYQALGAMAQARSARSARDALLFWSQAEAYWSSYITAGEGKKDRWLPIAKARLALVKAERAKAASAPPEPSGDGTDVTL
jgi:tetratricopeptide (TPR) repeat protein